MTLIAGAGLAGGGFVAATMFPEIREQLSDASLMAAEPDSPESVFGPEAFDLDQMSAPQPPNEPALGQPAPSAVGPAASAALNDFFGTTLPSGEATQPTAPRPASEFDSGRSWANATEQLMRAGVVDFEIKPSRKANNVRCECWINDGATQRVVVGEGQTPTLAVLDAVTAARRYQKSAGWFHGATP